MNCPRCNGFLVIDHTFDLVGDGRMVEQVKCLSCGMRTDPVMAVNFANPPDLTTAKKKRHHYPVRVAR